MVIRNPPTHEELRRLACRYFGVSGIELVDAGTLVDPSPLEREVASLLAPYRDYLDHDVVFDDVHLRRVLTVAGEPAPSLDDGVIQCLIAHALGPRRARRTAS